MEPLCTIPPEQKTRLTLNGRIYEYHLLSMFVWLQHHGECPVTRLPLAPYQKNKVIQEAELLIQGNSEYMALYSLVQIYKSKQNTTQYTNQSTTRRISNFNSTRVSSRFWRTPYLVVNICLLVHDDEDIVSILTAVKFNLIEYVIVNFLMVIPFICLLVMLGLLSFCKKYLNRKTLSIAIYFIVYYSFYRASQSVLDFTTVNPEQFILNVRTHFYQYRLENLTGPS